jgi:glucokinase
MAEESAAKRPESLLARLHRGTNRLTGAEVYQAMQQGDDAARQIVNTVGWWLGAGLATWSAIFKPDMVIIGGQVARLGQPYLQAVRRGLNDVGQPFLTEGITISPAALGVRAGIIGAASMFLKQRKA